MEDYRYQSWKEIEKGNIDANIIVMGNSRGLSHYVPSVLNNALKKKTYNLGFGGHPFIPQYFKLEYYLTHNKKPDIIIQNVDFLTFEDLNKIGHEREQVLPFVYDDYIRKEMPKYGFSFLELYLPSYRYFGYPNEIKKGLLEFLGIKHYKSKISSSGFLAEQGMWNPIELNNISSIAFIKDSTTVNLFEKYLEEMHANKIKVIMVYSPIYYRASLKIKNSQEMKDFFNSLASKHNITYFDYSNDNMCFDSGNFVIAVHLNNKGAETFSNKLAEDLSELIELKR